MNPVTLSELLKLSEAERIQLAQDLWDSIPDDSQALPLSRSCSRKCRSAWPSTMRTHRRRSQLSSSGMAASVDLKRTHKPT